MRQDVKEIDRKRKLLLDLLNCFFSKSKEGKHFKNIYLGYEARSLRN